uniref:CUE domain-containing protein n=1 Tax=viral metagenome TaxID=1070528 RepID=A0A6C0JI06_9ZZZZ
MERINIDNNYMTLINMYNQMFPSLDNSVIKMIMDENPENTVLDILLELSQDIPIPQPQPNRIEGLPSPIDLQSSKKPSPKNNSQYELEYEFKENEIDTNDNFTSYETVNDSDNEFDPIFGGEGRDRNKNKSFFGGLFKRNTYEKRFNPDDDL